MDTTNGPGTPPAPPGPPPGSGGTPGAPPADPPTRRPLLEQPRPAKLRPRSVDLRVGEGVLWIGAAALPLRHVTSVEVSRVKPDAVLRWLLVVGLVALGVSAVQSGDLAGGDALPLLVVVLSVLAFFALKDVFAPARPVLVVQTAAGSTAVVTLPGFDEPRQIADRVVQAIDDPSASFTVVVQRVGSQGNGDRHAPVVRVKGGRGGSGLTYR
ncbi:DUF6232 family protein [Streptomyces sp. NPDC058955]|uniref:DUF6232 family protein n=1 Tax=unclassified Streptomyces TaxID=2593676 RepID=UPI003649D14C